MIVDVNGGVGHVLSLTYGNLNNLSIEKTAYLFKNICIGLSVEDSYDWCRNCMRIRWIKTKLLLVVIKYDYILNTLYMYDVWEEKEDVLHCLRGDRGWTPMKIKLVGVSKVRIQKLCV